MIPMTKTVIIIDFKISHMRTLGLSIQNTTGPATVKLTIFHNHVKCAHVNINFYINNNDSFWHSNYIYQVKVVQTF